MSQGSLFADKPEIETAEPIDEPVVRSATPKAVQLLMPVWGERYIDQCLEFCIPTLLAPGNLPALAKALPCKFVFLTSSDGEAQLREDSRFRYLELICRVEIQVIEDLITDENHSTTITLAYERVVRLTGASMVDTCFFFLISDYLMADGSLAHVMERMMRGASGVLAGNFQVVERDAVKTFHERFDHGGAEFIIPPRQLVDWAFSHLHPMTAANMVNFRLSRSTQTNRLFWRVDENTLIGHFYLMHMICIRPEITDFVIASSCDYSFIPEMCPSNKVEVVTDSDDYLVIEMQPLEHEAKFLRLGSWKPGSLAVHLNEWTTARHRENVKFQLVFHSGELPPSFPAIARDAEAFIGQVERRLSWRPQPHRDHPYWVGAIVAHRWAISQKFGQDTSPSEILHQYNPRLWLVQRLRDRCFGRLPRPRPWHPLWPDFKVAGSVVRKFLSGANRRMITISMTPIVYANWFKEQATNPITNLHSGRLLRLDSKEYLPLVASFDLCLLVLGEDELELTDVIIERIKPLLAPDGVLLVQGRCGHGLVAGDLFSNLLARKSGLFIDRSLDLEKVEFLGKGRVRGRITDAMLRVYSGIARLPVVYTPVALLSGPFLILGSLIGNLLVLRDRSTPSGGQPCSSVVLVLRALKQSKQLPEFSDNTRRSRMDRDLKSRRHLEPARRAG